MFSWNFEDLSPPSWLSNSLKNSGGGYISGNLTFPSSQHIEKVGQLCLLDFLIRSSYHRSELQYRHSNVGFPKFHAWRDIPVYNFLDY